MAAPEKPSRKPEPEPLKPEPAKPAPVSGLIEKTLSNATRAKSPADHAAHMAVAHGLLDVRRALETAPATIQQKYRDLASLL